jgi:hypothetical protein
MGKVCSRDRGWGTSFWLAATEVKDEFERVEMQPSDNEVVIDRREIAGHLLNEIKCDCI